MRVAIGLHNSIDSDVTGFPNCGGLREFGVDSGAVLAATIAQVRFLSGASTRSPARGNGPSDADHQRRLYDVGDHSLNLAFGVCGNIIRCLVHANEDGGPPKTCAAPCSLIALMGLQIVGTIEQFVCAPGMRAFWRFSQEFVDVCDSAGIIR